MTGPLGAAREGGVRLSVHAQPGARRDEIAGLHGERLKVRVSAPPEDGRANERIVEVVAEAFGLRRQDVALVTGATSRAKDLLLSGITLEVAEASLQALLQDLARDEGKG